jgi:hypothetical protein
MAPPEQLFSIKIKKQQVKEYILNLLFSLGHSI